MTVMERLFREFKFELPSSTIKDLVISEDTVGNPEKSLEELLASTVNQQRELLKEEILLFSKRFEEDHKLTLNFTQEATDMLVDESLNNDKTIRAICEEKFQDYQYGLSLIAKHSDKNSFDITPAVIRNPDGKLSEWIVKHFKQDSSNQEESTTDNE